MNINSLVLQEAADKGDLLLGAFCFEWHCKYCKTSCFLIAYQHLGFLPKVVIIPRSCTWQNNQLHKMREIEDV